MNADRSALLALIFAVLAGVALILSTPDRALVHAVLALVFAVLSIGGDR